MAFEKKEWQYRDLISADELNRVEDGIQEALDTEGADLSAVNESIQSEANTRQAADEEEAKTREEEDTAIRSEMQSGLDEKVDKANVVNNLDVTDDGYVLDARVGAQIKEEIASGGTSDLITDVFMEQDSYSAGDYCIYNNVLYKFTADKEPGAWDESVVEATTVGAEIQENTDLIDSYAIVNSYTFTSITISAGGQSGVVSLSISNPTGYKNIGVAGINTTNNNITCSRVYLRSSTEIRASFINTDSASASADPVVWVLAVKC